MITVREYKIEDFAEIDYAVEPFTPPIPIEDFLEMTKRGLAVTSIENNNIMGCGGIAYINKKQGIVWLKISRKWTGFGAARTIVETFRLMKEAMGDLEISTYILENFCKGEKLARLIGLKKTGEMEEYNGNIYDKYTMAVM